MYFVEKVKAALIYFYLKTFKKTFIGKKSYFFFDFTVTFLKY